MTAEKYVESNPNSYSRLVVKRSGIAHDLYLYGQPIVDDICLVNTTYGEIHPQDFRVTQKCINPKSSIADKILISYHRRDPLGLCDLQMESCIRDRYPDKVILDIYRLILFLFLTFQNHLDIDLPIEDLATFVFPESIQLTCDIV
jgi:hypothetical protein